MVGNFGFLFNCTLAGQTSDSMTVPSKDLSKMRLLGADVVSVVGPTVGLLLLRYSVVCT